MESKKLTNRSTELTRILTLARQEMNASEFKNWCNFAVSEITGLFEKEEVKSAEEILKKYWIDEYNKAGVRTGMHIIFQKDAIEAMHEYATQFQSVQSKEENEERFYDCPKCGYRLTDLEYHKVNYDYGCPKCNTSFNEFKLIQSVKGEGERTAERELPLNMEIYSKAGALCYDDFLNWFNPIRNKLESYKHSESKDMYPKEFIEFLCDYYQKFWDRYILLNGEHVDPFNTKQPFFTFEEVFNHWSTVVTKR